MTPNDWEILAEFGVTPDNLSVDGDLDLSDTPISALPANLSVGRSLYLNNTPISALPDGLSVGWHIDLSGTDIKVVLTYPRGYELRHSNGWFVAGCHTFRSREEALAHWGSDEYPDKKRGAAFCAAINAVEVAL